MSNNAAPDPMAVLISRAAQGDRHAMRQLVTELTPVIRASVASVLARSGTAGRREARQEVEDATQGVLLALFADRGRVLLQWNPARGLSLESFVSLLAKRETFSLLRSRRRSPWTEDPTLHEDLDRNAVPRMGPESETISRDMLAALEDAVRTKLTPRGVELFDLFFMRGLPPEEVCTITKLSPEAVYAWKSRLTRQVKEILAELTKGPPTIPPSSLQDSNPGLRDTSVETMVRLRKSRPGLSADASSPGELPQDSTTRRASTPGRESSPGEPQTRPLPGSPLRRRGGAA